MSAMIEINNLTKQYGSLTALNSLTLSVEEGAVVGFIGPNGAGKTTTMRILTTLLKPSSGNAYVNGYSVAKNPKDVRRSIGYMPDFFGVYDDMKVWEYLDFFAACYDIPSHERNGMIDDLLALVDLNHKKDAYVEGLSRGMKQRLCLARTLAHDPQLLILDEPASGLDPRARIEMRELLLELRNMGKTIFFSSHILSEIADVCTEIAVMEAGSLVAHGSIEQMKQRLRANRTISVRFLGEPTPLLDLLLQNELVGDITTAPGVIEGEGEGDEELSADTIRFSFSGEDDALSNLLTTLVQHNIPIIAFNEEIGDLEDVFMQVTKGIVN